MPDDDFAYMLAKLRERLPSLVEYQTLMAQVTRARFNALVKEGFTDAQAIELCKDHKPI